MNRSVTLAIGPADDVCLILEQLREAAGDARITLNVALLPPLAQLRLVDLPRMTAEDARQAIGRNVGRYFPDAMEPQTVAVYRGEKGWLAAVAPTAMLSTIYGAARRHGWKVGTIAPAHVAWARAARQGTVSITGPQETTVLEVRRGEIVTSRRVRLGAALPDELTTVRAIGEEPEQAIALATSQASRGAVLDLLTESLRNARARSARRATWMLVAASVVMLITAAGATLWGERRELDALRTRRTSLRVQVTRLLASRDTIVSATERINALASLERSSERWSAVIAQVAEALPPDASLTAFRAEADSVSLEGQAASAAGVFAAMRSSPGFLAVRASSPVRQEGGEGQPVVERFSMAARVTRPGAPE